MNFEQMRALILDQAIRGLLEKQDIQDSMVPVIKGRLKKETHPFEIPNSWQWYPLGKILEYGRGAQVSSEQISETTWVLDLEDIEKGTGRLINKKRGTPSKSNKTQFNKGSVLYGKLRPYLNKVLIADENGVCTTEIVPINTETSKVPLLAKYLKSYLMSPFFLDYANKVSYGVKMPRLGTKDAKAALIPVPPIEEQVRIVKKLDTVFSEIIRAEKAYQELNRLSDILKTKILQKAIRGDLVAQLNSEEPVKNIKYLPKDIPFTIPKKWQWTTLGEVGRWKSGGTPSRSVPGNYENGTIPWLKTGDLNDGKITSVKEFITQQGIDNSSAHVNPKGAVLIAMYGATIGKLGLLEIDCATNQACCACVVKEGIIDNWYLFYYLLSQRNNFITLGSGGAQSNISKAKITNYPIPLPPIEEQKRIVLKIKGLFKTIDDLSL